MQAIKIQEGAIINYTAPADTAAGTVVVISGFVGVVNGDITSGGLVGVSLEGVYEVPFSGAEVGQGATLYWDAASGCATGTSAGGLVAMGKAAQTVTSGGAVVQVRLNN